MDNKLENFLIELYAEENYDAASAVISIWTDELMKRASQKARNDAMEKDIASMRAEIQQLSSTSTKMHQLPDDRPGSLKEVILYAYKYGDPASLERVVGIGWFNGNDGPYWMDASTRTRSAEYSVLYWAELPEPPREEMQEEEEQEEDAE